MVQQRFALLWGRSAYDVYNAKIQKKNAATSLMMANLIGVARTILANLPIRRHSQNRGRPLLGYVPLAPHRAYRVRRDPEPETPPDSPESTTNNTP